MTGYVKEFTLADVLGVPIMLPAGETSASTARHLLREALEGEMQEDTICDVELMTSELVGNSAEHGGSQCALAVSRPNRHVLRVAVSDWNQSVPRMARLSTDADRGRGLQLIAALSLRWGQERHPQIGNTVWFEVPI